MEVVLRPLFSVHSLFAHSVCERSISVVDNDALAGLCVRIDFKFAQQDMSTRFRLADRLAGTGATVAFVSRRARVGYVKFAVGIFKTHSLALAALGTAGLTALTRGVRLKDGKKNERGGEENEGDEGRVGLQGVAFRDRFGGDPERRYNRGGANFGIVA